MILFVATPLSPSDCPPLQNLPTTIIPAFTGLRPAAMGTRKRSRSEAVAVPQTQKNEEPGLLQKIRSFWEFASLMQYIAIFGKIMKIDEDFEIEVGPLERALVAMSACRIPSHED